MSTKMLVRSFDDPRITNGHGTNCRTHIDDEENSA